MGCGSADRRKEVFTGRQLQSEGNAYIESRLGSIHIWKETSKWRGKRGKGGDNQERGTNKNWEVSRFQTGGLCEKLARYW